MRSDLGVQPPLDVAKGRGDGKNARRIAIGTVNISSKYHGSVPIFDQLVRKSSC
jgi:hypothetical protein